VVVAVAMTVVVEVMSGEEALISKEYQACSGHALQAVAEPGKAVTTHPAAVDSCFNMDHSAVGCCVTADS
jgi:hypothetical protein